MLESLSWASRVWDVFANLLYPKSPTSSHYFGEGIVNPFYSQSTEPYGALFIEGTAHYDFSDLPLLSPLAPQLGLKGPINGKRVTVIVNDYLLSFFDMTLKGGASDLFTNPSLYAEVKPKP